MLKKLFLKLDNPTQTFNQEEKDILNNLVEEKFFKKVEGRYEIDTKYRIGVLKIEKNFAVLNDLENEHKNIKLQFDDLHGAYDGDLIIVKRVFNPRKSIKAKVVRVLNSDDNSILVYLKDGNLYSLKESVLLKIANHNIITKHEEGDVLLINSKTYQVVEKFGNLRDASVDEKISLFLYGEYHRLTDQEPSLDNETLEDEKRVDLRDLNFCTIDPASAKDHDDAICFDEKESILYVAIADVSYFVHSGSPLDLHAYKRSTSAYLPGKVLPMLPNSLSEELCSLKPEVDRYAYVFKIYLDTQDLTVKKSQLFEALITSKSKFSYGRIDRILDGKFDQFTPMDKNIFDSLIPLYEITKEFRAKRMQKGYDFRTSEVRQKLNFNKELEGVEIETSTASHQLVEECMLLANIEASKKVNNIGIYRIHEEPSFKAISKLVDDVNILGVKVRMKENVHSTITAIQAQAQHSMLRDEVDELIIQSQTQAKYSSKNLGHFGLGFKSYSHFTSPIRRYSDLVLHRMLKTKKVPKDIDDVCAHISVQERKVDTMVWDYEDRKYARWAAKHIGEELKVQVVDPERGIVKTYKDIPGIRIYVDNYKGEKLFLKLKVIIKEVDIVSKKIIGSIKN
mgnify:CR=1 FL=1